MATNTTNFNFEKPDENSYYDIDIQNNNWDKTDNILQELLAKIEKKGTAQKLIDDVTNIEYKLGVSDGSMYIEEVTE